MPDEVEGPEETQAPRPTGSYLPMTYGANFTATWDSQVVWNQWITSNYSTTVNNYTLSTEIRPRRARTAEEEEWQRAYELRRAEELERLRAREIERRAERMRLEAERKARMEAAEERARELLPLVLTPQELDHWERYQELKFTGSEGDTFRLERGHEGNVVMLDSEGRRFLKVCAHPQMFVDTANGERGRIPTLDAHIAQILAIKHDQDAFMGISNVYELADHSVEAEAEARAYHRRCREAHDERLIQAAEEHAQRLRDQASRVRDPVEEHQVEQDRLVRDRVAREALRDAIYGYSIAV